MEKIIIVDFGSQYTQLIARRIREHHVYSEIIPFHKTFEANSDVIGIILSGSPCSTLDVNAPTFDFQKFVGNIPILGICYGAQLIAHKLGGEVLKSLKREYGRSSLKIVTDSKNSTLLEDLPENSFAWMSHGDGISSLPEGFRITATTNDIPVAAFESNQFGVWGVQFHPEVTHTEFGKNIIFNFVTKICNCSGNWKPETFIKEAISRLRENYSEINGKKPQIICALSGGVDSSVTAAILNTALPGQVHCILVDNGLMRKNEIPIVLEAFQNINLTVKNIDAGNLFLSNLKGVTDPEEKRKIIGRTFIDVFDKEANSIQGATHLAQGTIYPDIIESSGVNGTAQVIKSHHNVGGLPEKMKLNIIEPLKMLFKDEVREVGLALGLPSQMINRHPFPGPGLGIRILGEIDSNRVKILQEADDIFISKLRKFEFNGNNLYNQVWQAFAVLLPIKSVGVMGDERTYENVLVLRAVTSVDGMTADWAHLPYEFLSEVSGEIINSVKGINRVTYDISSKPPSTIEWE